MFNGFYRGKRVFITGHTGFKGSWLSEWLLLLGAHPVGYSLDPETNPSLFNQLGLEKRVDHHISDIRNARALTERLEAAQPDVVFHLAAQPLVRRSYAEPIVTYETNVMGTVHLLDALRFLKKPCSVVIITTDKCYENKEWNFGYRENDPLGGHDPYSASKACSELAVQSYRKSYFETEAKPYVAIASARAGNVIGGGDWSEDRIVPDSIRALSRSQPIPVRNPHATRPWQHVLEPLSGYLLLGQLLYPENSNEADGLCGAYNFGPGVDSNQTVAYLIEKILGCWPGTWQDDSGPQSLHEAELLNLTTDKAWHNLRWQSVWDFEMAVKKTVEWYRDVIELQLDSERTSAITRDQILTYHVQARCQKQRWACED